jgi:hypothetical protein
MRPVHRYDAHAVIVPGEHELLIGARAELLRLVLTDDGPLTDALTGEERTTPDVFCHLTARQARQLADRLRALADQLAITPLPTPTTR